MKKWGHSRKKSVPRYFDLACCLAVAWPDLNFWYTIFYCPIFFTTFFFKKNAQTTFYNFHTVVHNCKKIPVPAGKPAFKNVKEGALTSCRTNEQKLTRAGLFLQKISAKFFLQIFFAVFCKNFFAKTLESHRFWRA